MSNLGPRFCLLVFPHFYSVLGHLKNHKWCVGVRNYFLAGCRGVNKMVLKKRVFWGLFYVGERKREKIKKWKRTISTKHRKIVFLGGCEQKRSWGVKKLAFFRNIGKHYLCSEGKKPRIFVDSICFGKMVLFLVTIQNHQTLQKYGVSAGTGENPKWHFWFQTCLLGRSP